jgi:hypothetical protein
MSEAPRLTACFRTLILVFSVELAREQSWPKLKYARYSRFGRPAITPIALKNPSARVRKQAVNGIVRYGALVAYASNQLTRSSENAARNSNAMLRRGANSADI